MWVTKEAGTMFVLRILVKIVPYISRDAAANLDGWEVYFLEKLVITDT